MLSTIIAIVLPALLVQGAHGAPVPARTPSIISGPKPMKPMTPSFQGLHRQAMAASSKVQAEPTSPFGSVNPIDRRAAVGTLGAGLMASLLPQAKAEEEAPAETEAPATTTKPPRKVSTRDFGIFGMEVPGAMEFAANIKLEQNLPWKPSPRGYVYEGDNFAAAAGIQFFVTAVIMGAFYSVVFGSNKRGPPKLPGGGGKGPGGLFLASRTQTPAQSSADAISTTACAMIGALVGGGAMFAVLRLWKASPSSKDSLMA